MKMKKWEVLPKWPADPERWDFCFHSDNYLPFLLNLYIYAFLGASKMQWVLPLTLSACLWKWWRLAQSGSVSLTDRLTKALTDGRAAGEREKGGYCVFHVCLCDSRKLTICGLHDTGVVVVAPGNASHRGHLGPLCVTWGAFRQPRHIGGRWVVICSERGVGS